MNTAPVKSSTICLSTVFLDARIVWKPTRSKEAEDGIGADETLDVLEFGHVRLHHVEECRHGFLPQILRQIDVRVLPDLLQVGNSDRFHVQTSAH